MEFLPQGINCYSIEHTTSESDLLRKLNRETWAKVMGARMISGHLQGRMLSMMSQMIKPTTILEIGTYTGYSALCLAEGLTQNGKIHTIDINEEFIAFSKKYFKKSNYKKNIIQHQGRAIDVIPKITDQIQLVFIDADKENYSNYYHLVFEKVQIGGYIIADNVLWSGKVTNQEKDSETQSLDEYNKLIQSDKRTENILLPIRDGLMICKKISN